MAGPGVTAGVSTAGEFSTAGDASAEACGAAVAWATANISELFEASATAAKDSPLPSSALS
ncbi:hypothetical protein D3C85_1789510 [compost metagenome]